MKKKLLIFAGVIALNIVAFTSLQSATPGPPVEDPRYYQRLQCDCDTGEQGQGDCEMKSCVTWGLEESCLFHQNCAPKDPPPPSL